ncbi:hypothetical protein HOLleu_38575 [Holothuria leucospilota]|uniref:C2H2-type domain-containing protein n=1 Tax=Holothuria leucospilota TaxID=206669 RepID=A0A9Q1BCB9_HOLLE|nr:hypothetical protein HOLleu_38575 [Holothuria leucospilota]
MTSFTCCKCLQKIPGGMRGLFTHLKLVHLILTSTCTKIICAEGSCKTVLWRGSSYKRHLIVGHMNARHNECNERQEQDGGNDHNNEPGGKSVEVTGGHVGEPVHNVNEDEDLNHEPAAVMHETIDETVGQTREYSLQDIHDSVAVFIARLHSSAVPTSFIQAAVQECKNLVETIVCHVDAKLSPLLVNIETGKLPSAEEIEEMKSLLKSLKTPFREMETEFMQTKYLCSGGVLVPPVAKVLGKGYKVHTDRLKGRIYQEQVNETFQYIPIRETKKRFLQQPGVMSSILSQHEPDDGFLHSYRDGLYFKQMASQTPEEIILPVLLYSDDFETVNPLGSRKGIHKLTAVYLCFLCLPSKYQASLQNIILVALATTPQIAKYNIDSVLAVISVEMQELEKTGIEIVIPGEYKGLVKPPLFQVTGDNLALNLMLGYVTSFTASYYCRICKMRRNVAKTATVEDAKVLRTQRNFAEDIEKDNFKETGIKQCSSLNTIPYYHVVSNLALDIMHDFQEGILPLEMKLILNELVAKEIISVDELNSRLKSFNFGLIDKTNRPSPILSSHLTNPAGASGQKAAQMKCLAIFLPLIIGDKVEEDSDLWELYLLLLEIFKLIIAPRMSRAATYFLKNKIEEHHILFKRLFPERTLTPKQHNCIHYPRAIRFLGPLIQYSVIRMEAKHKQLKGWAKTSNNFINIAKSLADKHQQAQGFNFMMKQHIASRSVEIKSQSVVWISSLLCSDEMCEALGCSPEEHITLVRTAEINGYTFRPNVMVLVKWEDEPLFAKVEHIVVIESDIKLLTRPWTTLYFHHHYSAYAVKEDVNSKLQVVTMRELFHHKPLHTVNCYDPQDSQAYIAMHFKLA